MKIQAILFDRNIWTLLSAESWLKKHELYPIKKVHITKNYYRYRMTEPKKNKKYTTVKIDEYDGILFILIY